MHSAASEQETSSWLVSDGLKELELLLQAVLSYQSEPILIVNDERCCLDASPAPPSCSAFPCAGLSASEFSILWNQTSFPARRRAASYQAVMF